jgi:uridylate kinase
MDRVQGDYMGMLATVGMALQGALEQRDAYPFTNCIKIEAIAEPYIKRRAVRHLEKGRIVILEPEPETLILPLIQQLFCVV